MAWEERKDIETSRLTGVPLNADTRYGNELASVKNLSGASGDLKLRMLEQIQAEKAARDKEMSQRASRIEEERGLSKAAGVPYGSIRLPSAPEGDSFNNVVTSFMDNLTKSNKELAGQFGEYLKTIGGGPDEAGKAPTLASKAGTAMQPSGTGSLQSRSITERAPTGLMEAQTMEVPAATTRREPQGQRFFDWVKEAAPSLPSVPRGVDVSPVGIRNVAEQNRLATKAWEDSLDRKRMGQTSLKQLYPAGY